MHKFIKKTEKIKIALLSNKIKSSVKILLVEGEKLVTNDKGNADTLNTFFSNVLKNLKIPDFSDNKPLADNISHPTLKATMKYRNHSIISEIENKTSGKNFDFSRVSEKDIVEEF